MFKINVDSKIDKKLFVFQIIAFELVAVNSPYYYENTHLAVSVLKNKYALL